MHAKVTGFRKPRGSAESMSPAPALTTKAMSTQPGDPETGRRTNGEFGNQPSRWTEKSHVLCHVPS